MLAIACALRITVTGLICKDLYSQLRLQCVSWTALLWRWMGVLVHNSLLAHGGGSPARADKPHGRCPHSLYAPLECGCNCCGAIIDWPAALPYLHHRGLARHGPLSRNSKHVKEKWKVSLYNSWVCLRRLQGFALGISCMARGCSVSA